MLLLLGNKEDATLQGVAQAAGFLGFPILIVAAEHLLHASFEISDYYGKDQFSLHWKMGGERSINLLNFRGVLNRINSLSVPGNPNLVSEDQDYHYKEMKAYHHCFLSLLLNCINPASEDHLQGSHFDYPSQFAWAKEAEWKILPFLSTQSDQEAELFRQKYSHNVIIRNSIHDYRVFHQPKKKRIQKQAVYHLVKRPNGIPCFFHVIDGTLFAAKGIGKDQKEFSIFTPLKRKIEKLIHKSKARFIEILAFETSPGHFVFGYFSTFPMPEHYWLHQEEIHLLLAKQLWYGRKESKKSFRVFRKITVVKKKTFIPKMLRPKVGRRSS